MNNGWFCLHRKIKDWEWYNHAPTTKIYLDCLASAYFADSEWRGIKIKKGQFPTTVETLATTNGLTTQQTRTALKNLQTTNEIEVQTTNRYSVITVNRWDLYQTNNKRINKQTGGGANKQKTTQTTNLYNNNINNKTNNSNISNINISSSSSIEEPLPKISEEEEELLKKHSKRNKVKYFKPWLRKVLSNGDYKEILEKEQKRQTNITPSPERGGVIETPPPTPEEEQQIKEIQARIKRGRKK